MTFYNALRDLLHYLSENITWDPPKINAPALLLSLTGIQAETRVFRAGNVVPSPNPSRTRIAIKPPAPPYWTLKSIKLLKWSNLSLWKIKKVIKFILTASGVRRVRIAVDN